MSSTPTPGQQHPSRAAMEGGGFYNRHSAMQAAGVSLLLPYWEEVVRTVAIEGEPLVIVDYGSSQGRNSMAPMRIAIDELRGRTGAQTDIAIVHADLASNDFTALFVALEDDPESYLTAGNRIFPSAIGRSYFQPILPPESVHLAWNTWTMSWLSGAPPFVPDHMFAWLSKTPEVVAAFRDYQASDWRRFLSYRSAELRNGAKMLTAFPSEGSNGTGWEWLCGEFWEAAVDLGREGLLSRDELLRFVIPPGPRDIEAIRAPFAAGGRFEGLEIELADILTVPDPAWIAYEQTGDVRQFAQSHADTTRAWAGPTISHIFGSRPDKAAVVDRLLQRLAERLAVEPRPHQPALAVVVLRKAGR